MGKGKVCGDTAGVSTKLLGYMKAVADHYGKTIEITSGVRSKRKQAEIMWKDWNEHLDRGEIYDYLKMNPLVREKLDALRNPANTHPYGPVREELRNPDRSRLVLPKVPEFRQLPTILTAGRMRESWSEPERMQKFYDMVEPIARPLSSHVREVAADVALTTDRLVLEALRVGLYYKAEWFGGQLKCHHFDTRIYKSPDLIKHWPGDPTRPAEVPRDNRLTEKSN